MAEELKPCPFCGGQAEIIHIEDGENAGGSCVCCTRCFASGNVEFGFKENFVSNWNCRSFPETQIHRAVLDWIRSDAGMAVKLSITPEQANALSARIATAIQGEAQ